MTSLPIPTTLDEAVDHIYDTMDDKTKRFWRTHTLDESVGSVHMSAGAALRNGWKLWQHKTKLSKRLSELGFSHADDRSSVILHAVWHALNRRDHDVAAEAESNRLHWAAQGVNIDGTPLT